MGSSEGNHGSTSHLAGAYFRGSSIGGEPETTPQKPPQMQISVLGSISWRSQPGTLTKKIFSFPDILLYFLLQFYISSFIIHLEFIFR